VPQNPLLTSTYGRGLHGDVVTALGRQIVGGDLRPGDVLNMGRLEEEFSVSRTVLREAVRVLSAKGLLEARPRRGTTVRPRSDWSLLDPDVVSWQVRNGPDEHFLRNLEEVRRIVEPQVARLAAARRNEEDLSRMLAALEDLSKGSEAVRKRAAVYVTADLSFHHALFVASHNDLLTQLSSILENALKQRDALVHKGKWRGDTSFVDLHRAVFEAIRAQDEDRAGAAMHALLAQALSTVEAVLSRKGGTSRRASLPKNLSL
jgi:GntR family galactonate operon transcriptional repressor